MSRYANEGTDEDEVSATSSHSANARFDEEISANKSDIVKFPRDLGDDSPVISPLTDSKSDDSFTLTKTDTTSRSDSVSGDICHSSTTSDPIKSNEYDVSQINEENKNLTLHGVIASVSPSKTSKTTGMPIYLGKIEDGKKTLKFTCYNPKLSTTLKKFSLSRHPIKMEHVKTRLRNDNLRVYLSDKTQLEESERVFDVPATNVVPLIEVPSKASIIQVYVEDVILPRQVTVRSSGENVKCQTVIISDDSGKHELILWGANCNVLEKGTSYRITDVHLNENGKLGITSYSQIDEVEEDLSGFEIAAVTTHTNVVCKYCEHVAPPSDVLTYECDSCKRTYLRKNLKRKIGASVELERDADDTIVSKCRQFSSRQIMQLLQWSEMDLLKKTKKEITNSLLGHSM